MMSWLKPDTAKQELWGAHQLKSRSRRWINTCMFSALSAISTWKMYKNTIGQNKLDIFSPCTDKEDNSANLLPIFLGGPIGCYFPSWPKPRQWWSKFCNSRKWAEGQNGSLYRQWPVLQCRIHNIPPQVDQQLGGSHLGFLAIPANKKWYASPQRLGKKCQDLFWIIWTHPIWNGRNI